MRRRRNTESYSRKKKYVDPRPFFIIVCEGKVTEVDYFKSFPYYQNLGGVSSCGYIYSHAPIYIEPEAGQHEQVVHRACRIYAELNKKYGSILPKEVWCIFDCDNDVKRLNNAIQLAKAKGFNYIYSIQCFELWYLLHFQMLTTAINKREYDKRISKNLGINYSHGTIGMYKLLENFQRNAICNARQLWEQKSRIDELQSDPITNVFQLVEALNDAYRKLNR
ncbi:MAG: RloB domain-containing protein [Gracilibacteraceae bacterium]|nr:RloB domain-containing protein [Gracilibacteraceae bacterium]